MPLDVQLLPASTDHASPWPPVGAPCCGEPITDREPVTPGWMLMGGMDGMVITDETAMDPALRGLSAPRPWSKRMAPGPRFGDLGEDCGCGGGAKRTALSGLRGLGSFPPSLLEEAGRTAGAWAAEAGLTLPPMPQDVVAAIYQLALTERDLEVLRQKLRAVRAVGLPLSSEDVSAYNTAATSYYKAALGIYNPVIALIRRADPTTAALIPPVTRPPGLEAPDREIPWVPTSADVERIRSGDFAGITGTFASYVNQVRARVGGGAGGAVRGLRGLGDGGIVSIPLGTLILIIIGLLSIVAVVIAIAVPMYALTQVLAARAASEAAAGVAERRRAIYERCLAASTGTTECARQAEALAPMPKYPPGPGLELGLGGIAVGLGLAGAAYYFLMTPAGRKTVGLSSFKPRKFRGRRW